LQGDLKAAAAAFEKITQADPQNPDGWTNIGRVLVQEGDTAGARKVLEKSLSINPRLARTNFFTRAPSRKMANTTTRSLFANRARAVPARPCCAQRTWPRSVLEKRYADAVKEFEQTLSIDPKTFRHYNLMLCYNGLGNDAKANEHKARYLRFKADESAQAITGLTAKLIPRTITSGKRFTNTSASRLRRRRPRSRLLRVGRRKCK